jgi:hypothetical protein
MFDESDLADKSEEQRIDDGYVPDWQFYDNL